MWHPEAITGALEGTLRDLGREPALGAFYLAGGTGLALHLGHRRSGDLDFFAVERFDEDELLQRIQHISGFAVTSKAPGALHTVIQETKVSFCQYVYPVLFPFAAFLGVKIADVPDIACMKLSAIASRGTKRDFIDLYTVAKQLGLDQQLQLFNRKYAQAACSMVHVLKCLTYFEDAEKDPMPHLLASISWDEVKRFFRSEAPRLLSMAVRPVAE
jgi:hypothetical protein